MHIRKILIIDDHAMFCAGLRMLLYSALEHVEVSSVGSLKEAIHGREGREPDLVLLDIKLPGLNGMDGISLLRRYWASVPVIMLSSLDDRETIKQALDRGAAGFVSKAESEERIITLIRKMLAGDMDLPAPSMKASTSAVRLTPRQCEVLELLCEGLSNKLIARRLELSENTVRWHVQAILEVLQVCSRSEAAFIARQRGLVG